MKDTGLPIAAVAAEVVHRNQPSVYLEPFASRMARRRKPTLGSMFELNDFDVNLSELAPWIVSALRHTHTRRDEFINVLQGYHVLRPNAGVALLAPGMCGGFAVGTSDTHQLFNPSDEPVLCLEAGDRTPCDAASYQDDDLLARQVDGHWCLFYKEGTPYRTAPTP